MKAEALLALYERVADAPDAIARLRRFVLDLAVRGKLSSSQSGWKRTTLGEVGEWGSGGTPSKSNPEYYGGDIPWLVIGDLNDSTVTHAATHITEQGLKNSSAKLVPPGTVLIAMYGSIGKLGIAGITCATNQAIAHCSPNHELVSTNFLTLLLRGMREDLLASGQGVAQQNISQKILKAWPIHLPPLAEQHRIVAKVDELMALLDRLEAARSAREATRDRLTTASLTRLTTAGLTRLTAADSDPEALRTHARFALDALPAFTIRADQIKQLRQTILNLAVRGLLAPQVADEGSGNDLLQELEAKIATSASPKRKSKALASDSGSTLLTHKTEQTPLPSSWACTNLGRILTQVTSGSRGWAEHYSESGATFIRAQNIRFGQLKLEHLAYVIPPSGSEGSRTRVSRGDLLIVITGAGVTNPAMLDVEVEEGYVSQHVALARPADVRLSRWLLLCLMAEEGGRRVLVERAYGSGKPGLNLDHIRSLVVPLPPLLEQHRIVTKVDELMALCDRLEAALQSADTSRARLLEALLHEALAGREPEAEAA